MQRRTGTERTESLTLYRPLSRLGYQCNGCVKKPPSSTSPLATVPPVDYTKNNQIVNGVTQPMNEVMQTILNRHSCRTFTDQPIEPEKIDALLTAALWAPSGRNEQSWHFTMITNPEKIQRLASAVREADNRPASYNFFAPAAFFIVSGERDNRNCFLDGAAAMENVLLAATSLGLGSCWINQVRDVCDNPQVRAILTEYGVPESHIVNASAALGYAAQPSVVHERKSGLVSIVD